jgi:SAM-dependent methyltransferase
MAEVRVADCSQHPAYDPALEPTIRWNRCADCSHVFTAGHYTEKAFQLILRKALDNQRVGEAAEQNRMISARMVEKVLPYATGGIWLDVGFGNGSLLFTAQEYGFRPVGLDLRAANVNTMRSIGIEAHCAELAGLSLREKCAVISMADVLEHVPYPGTVLAAARGLLRKGGVLLVSMPNTENMVWKLLDAAGQNPYWGELEHYHNFSRSRLYALLAESGFEPVRYGISERYRVCMEVVALLAAGTGESDAA